MKLKAWIGPLGQLMDAAVYDEWLYSGHPTAQAARSYRPLFTVEWLPIDLAPDGEKILVRWAYVKGSHKVVFKRGHCFFDDNGQLTALPDQWMPLPP